MQDKFNFSHILKIDLDVKPRPFEFDLWKSTRTLILSSLGYHVVKVNTHETKKGYHVWVHILEELGDYEVALLQFLCGDDSNRARLNLWREDNGCFGEFNLLFNHKRRMSIE